MSAPKSFASLFIGVTMLWLGGSAATAPSGTGPRMGPISPSPEPITSVAAAFARWPDLKTDEGMVWLEGVVTGTMPSGAFRLHDGNLGIYVTKSADGQRLSPGDQVAVSGVLRKGGFSPWITPYEVTPLGRGKFPEPQPATYSTLSSGAADNQWVEIEGVVRAVHLPETHGLVVLEFGMVGGTLRVLVNGDDPAEFESLIDAAVTMRGVAAVNVNAQKHVVEPSFRVPSSAHIAIRRPGQPDPFTQQLVPLDRLMRFSLGASHLHRVRTSGVVTRRMTDTVLFLRDGTNSLKVETGGPHPLRPGDVIEAAGFPVIVEGMAVLQQATCRTVGTSTPPVPAEPTLATLLDGTHNSDLVGIKARFVDWVLAGQNVTLVFQVGDQFFNALYTLPASQPLSLPEKNSLVHVQGVCVINELEELWYYRPRSFLLLLAGLDDLQVLQAPPWWTPERLWRALVITSFVLVAAAAWVWALRRQIDRKRAVIEQQARHAAALDERGRIARDLHDTLEQGLTGLSLQLKALETDLGGATQACSRLRSARQMLRQSRALARNAIRELRNEAVPSRLEGLIDGLKRVANSWIDSGALAVDVEIVGEPRPLPPPLEPHLLGIGTEAMTNAVKHGRAASIRVNVNYRAREVVMRITDNGMGFDPSQHLEQTHGCFGLIGMHERAREIRGELRIQSQPGHGTEIIVTAPIIASPQAVAPDTDSACAAQPRPVQASVA